MFIDTHTHLNFKAFEDDWQEVVKEASKAGVEKMVVIGTDLKSSKKAIKMAEKTKGLWATVGFHPHHCKSITTSLYHNITEELEKLAKNKKVVGIGECGLDYHVYQKTKYEKVRLDKRQKVLQKIIFGKQIQLAKKLNLPIVIHNRKAQKDILDVIDHFCKSDNKYPKGVFHCVSGSKKYLKAVLKKGFYAGVDGNVTYSEEVRRLIKLIPLDRLLIETDSPYLLPEPLRSSNKKVPELLQAWKNKPVNVKIVTKYIARLKGTSINQIEKQTYNNAKKLFNF